MRLKCVPYNGAFSFRFEMPIKIDKFRNDRRFIYDTYCCLIFEEDNKRRIYDNKGTHFCFLIADVNTKEYSYAKKKRI